MRLRRFFCDLELGSKTSTLITSGSLVNQLKNVFRLGKGDEVILFDNSGYDFRAVINSFEKDSVSFTITETLENNIHTKREVYLFSSIVKKDNFEWIVQKATELGVSHIVPVVSERTEKKDLNIERLNKIIIEASEQSGRAKLPTLHDVGDLKSVLEKYKSIPSIAWHIESQKFVSQEVHDVIGAYVGPEGGWSSNEIELFESHNIKIRSLGEQVLRSETAVVAVLSQYVF